MLYHSTRGLDESKNFSEVLHSGLAGDGGLFVPKSIPMLNLFLYTDIQNSACHRSAISPIDLGLVSQIIRIKSSLVSKCFLIGKMRARNYWIAGDLFQKIK